jgi:hypothetical protein
VEVLEDRLTPSSTFTPTQIRHAYGFDRVVLQSASNSAITGDGAGQTIALIDAFDDPNIASDLAVFDNMYSLVPPPSFTKVDQTGGTNYPQPSAFWAGETALDVEYAHAVAPGANILLVEATDNLPQNLTAAVQYAASHGATVVSMSFGSNELSSETAEDSTYTSPGVTYLAATGDDGAPGGYPAFSPDVVAVGGTSLVLDSSGNYSSESGWSGSGGGISRYEAQPAYQKGVVTQSTSKRTIPDVSFEADSDPGVFEYDTFGGTGLEPTGGTSLACPIMAGLTAIIDQGRSYVSGQSSYSSTDFLTALYQLPRSDFHDITTGNNGYAAGPGYDLVTGRGTPLVGPLVADLIGSSPGTTLSASAATSVYGQPVTFTATVTNGGRSVRGGSVTFTDGSVTLGTVPIDRSGQAVYSTSTLGVAGSPHTITATYNPPGGTSQGGSSTVHLTVTPAPLTISADNKTRAVGQPNPTLTASYSGLADGDTPASLGGTLTLTTTATTFSPPGQYPITVSGLTSANYTIQYVSGTLTVAPGIISLTSSASPSVYGQAVTFTATVTAGGQPIAGVSVTFSEGGTLLGSGTTDATGAATWTASALTAGSHALTAAWTGSGRSGSFTQTVNPTVLTITVGNLTRVYGSANPTPTFDYSGFVNRDTLAVVSGLVPSTPATPSSGVGSYPITGAGASAANYAFVYVSGVLTVTPAILTVTANDASRNAGAANPTFTASYSGFVLGQSLATSGVTGSPTLITTAGPTSPTGTYPISPLLGSLASTSYNYTFVFNPGTLTVARGVAKTVGLFDPSTATWYLRNSNSAADPGVGSFSYGVPGWLPVVGDWLGNGSTTVGVVDPATATWYLRNENSPGAPDAGVFQFGLPGWIPVVGDWTHSGHSGIGMFNPSTATWYLRSEVGPGAPDAGVFSYGVPGWVPVTGDWSGNGTTTVGVFDPSTATWYLRNSNSAGAPDAGSFVYGVGSWTPVVGNWAGGASTVGVVDPATSTWYLRGTNSAGVPDLGTLAFGVPGSKPVAGLWAAPSSPKASQLRRGDPGSDGWSATVAADLERLQGAGSTAAGESGQAGLSGGLAASQG